MQGVNHFIVHVPESHNEHLKTKSGVKLLADKRHSTNLTANKIFEVVEIPLKYNGPIKKGWWLMVDPSIVFEHTYEKGGKQESQYLINRKKRHFKVEPQLIIAFRETDGSKWEGFEDNVICETLKSESKNYEKVGSIYILEAKTPKSNRGQMKICVGNKNIFDLGVFESDIVFVNQQYSVPLNIEGVNYHWLRTKEILAINPQ